MTVGSLFSGIGGFDLAMTWAGFEIAWQVEIDPFCRAVLAKHWPQVERFADVRECSARNLRDVDVLCAGFPCQPVSLAGKQLAQRDERWLWPEVSRLVRELRPRVVVLENVPGLLVHGMRDVLGDLAEAGYDAEWTCLRAADVGAPHKRERVFVIGRRVDMVDATTDRQLRRAADQREGADRLAVEAVAVSADAGRADESALADAKEFRPETRQQSDRSSECLSHTEGGVEPQGEGSSTLADTDRERQRGGWQSEPRRQQGARGHITDGCRDGRPGAEACGVRQADPVRERLEGAECADVARPGERRSDADAGRPVTDHRWPSRPGEEQHEWEPPRVLRRAESGVGVVPDGLSAGLVRHRRRALAALGNAIVPQCAYLVAQRVRQVIDARGTVTETR